MLLRTTTLALLAFGLSASFSTAQEITRAWRDPAGRLSVTYPASWQAHEIDGESDGAIRLFVGAGDYECQIWSIPKASSASASPDAIRRSYTQPLSAAQWQHIVEPLSYFSTGVEATDISVDTSGAWPVQHVMLHGGGHDARGTLQGRPGAELLSLCLSFDSQDRSAIFAQIEASIDAPNASASSVIAPGQTP